MSLKPSRSTARTAQLTWRSSDVANAAAARSASKRRFGRPVSSSCCASCSALASRCFNVSMSAITSTNSPGAIDRAVTWHQAEPSPEPIARLSCEPSLAPRCTRNSRTTAWSCALAASAASVTSRQSSASSRQSRELRTRQLVRRQSHQPQEGIVAPLHRAQLDDRNRLAGRVEHGALDPQRLRQSPLARLQGGQIRIHADHAGKRAIGPLQRRGTDRHDQAPAALGHVHRFEIANRLAFAQRFESCADRGLVDVGRAAALRSSGPSVREFRSRRFRAWRAG